jgi:hypothetical protein
MVFDKHEPVGADTKFWMTDPCNLIGGKGQARSAIINDHKVIACCLVFMEVNGVHFEDY